MNEPLTAAYDKLIPKYVRNLVEEQQRLIKRAEAALTPLGTDVFDLQRRLSSIDAVTKTLSRWYEDSERWAEAIAIVQTELPKRGWYLTGQDPCSFTPKLARIIREKNWEELDRLLVRHATQLKIDIDAFATWLQQHGVLECCVNRVRIFLEARTNGQHDTATLVGLPTIDEVTRALFGGKDFTSQRGRTKPQLACATTDGESQLTHYSKGFVEAFGVIQMHFDPKRAEDEDYFNRNAILHGLMRRSYGPKDSAKTFMGLMFVTFAFDDEGEDAASAK